MIVGMALDAQPDARLFDLELLDRIKRSYKIDDFL